MKIIGIDPGTNCGWALIEDGRRLASGTWNLAGKRHEGGGMRYLRFRRSFLELLSSGDIDAIAYEEVRRHEGVDAAHIYGGIIAQIAEISEGREIPFSGIPVGTAKRVATGRGNCSKIDMIEAANEKWELNLSIEKKDKKDNEADALWMAYALWEEIKVDGLLADNADSSTTNAYT
jgi:crossover junction endodeoxyribonuclease RuvC